MKATIYKNDNFETVGLKVEHADVTIFVWGVICEQYYYTKTINADPYTAEVLDLIKLERMRQYYEWDFSKEVCETNMDARNMAKRKSKKDLSTFIEIDKEMVQELEQAIQNKIRQISK